MSEPEFDIEDLEPRGRAKRLPDRGKKLGGAVPVRFQPEVVERIKIHAEREGQTVSSWIRGVVEHALADQERKVIVFPQVRRHEMTGAEAHRLSMVQNG